VFVDHGLLRQNEGDMVRDMFARNLGVKVISVDASAQFLADLKGVSDPEHKRKIIGRDFVEVFQAQAKQLPRAKWLAQGTIYPDVIESASAKTKKAHTIKSHHNVGGLPETLNLKLLEPLRELFKDEVRELGVALGLPREMVYRHPFPGPGLGVRILGEVTREAADLLRRAGGSATNPGAASTPAPLPEPLSTREREVLALLAAGCSYREIADQLIVALGTVQAHCGSIYGKLGVRNRTQAVLRAGELHLLP